MNISVIICTRNPRREYLDRVLAALRRQTYPADAWETIIVDNASDPPLRVENARCRVVVESRPGLTNARLKGIAEAAGEWLVFVDDDNILDADYLANAAAIWAGFPQLAALGGRSSPEFESPPPEWLSPFYPHLALITVDADCWSNRKDFGVFPCGAGLCIRRELALMYAMEVKSDERRLKLDRSDRSLISCGDTDMVLHCIRHGWGVGRFRNLHLTHIIPRERLEYAYHKRLAYGIGYSVGVLRAIDGPVSLASKTKALVVAVLGLITSGASGPARWIEFANRYGYWRGVCKGTI